jgi:hypothetical protein
MKAMLAAGMFLLLGLVGVLACTQYDWSNGPISRMSNSGYCSDTAVRSNGKYSYWAVKYPSQPVYTAVASHGTGKCVSSIPSLCWPIFYTH